jgi:hypothetical protein
MGMGFSSNYIISILYQDICTQIAPDLHNSMKQGRLPAAIQRLNHLIRRKIASDQVS